MPKQEFKILAFHGGINDNSDPRDIEDKEFRLADGVSFHRLGKIVGLGNKGSALSSTLTGASVKIEPGYGLHFFSQDYDKDGNNNSEDYLAMYNKSNNKIKFYYRDKPDYNSDGDEDPGFIDSSHEVTFGGNIKPNYYYGEGMLRISDANLASQSSKWFGYIDSSLYWTNSSGNTNNVHDIKKFSSGNQKFNNLNSLAGQGLKLQDITEANPTENEIGSQTGRLILGYMKDEGGEWNGNYTFGATPVFKDNQEGPITPIYSNLVGLVEDILPLYNNRMSFQVYISMGTSNTISSSTNHILGNENRMIGINWYFKEQGDDEWTFLRHTDLREGGKHYWKVFDATNQGTHGIWTGSNVEPGNAGTGEVRREGVSIWSNEGTINSAIHFSDKADGTGTNWMSADGGSAPFTDYNTNTTGKSYAQVYLRVKIKNNNAANGFDNRFGFLRIWGGAVSPLYVSAVGTSLIKLKTGTSPNYNTDDTYYVPITLPSLGTDREFRVQVLDENFNVIADTGIYTITITDSGAAVPPEYEQEVEIG